MASTIVRRAMGSCPERSICQLVAPRDSAASTGVGGTPRMPSAVSRMQVGTA
jgi:hypothetical protein